MILIPITLQLSNESCCISKLTAKVRIFLLILLNKTFTKGFLVIKSYLPTVISRVSFLQKQKANLNFKTMSIIINVL